MSNKISAPLFRILLQDEVPKWFEGVIVSPDKLHYASSLQEIHTLLLKHQAFLCYEKSWIYVPQHSLLRITGSSERRDFPWPLI